jgi:hypothetical protein
MNPYHNREALVDPAKAEFNTRLSKIRTISTEKVIQTEDPESPAQTRQESHHRLRHPTQHQHQMEAGRDRDTRAAVEDGVKKKAINSTIELAIFSV